MTRKGACKMVGSPPDTGPGTAPAAVSDHTPPVLLRGVAPGRRSPSAGRLLRTATPSWLATREQWHPHRGQCGRSPEYDACDMSLTVRVKCRE